MMRKTYLYILAVFVCVASPASAKEFVAHTQKPQIVDDGQFETLEKRGMPAEMQKVLDSFTGEWSYASLFWPRPGSSPDQSTGSSSNEMIMKGRFLSMKSSGILNIDGRYLPFERTEFLGYDNTRKILTAVGMDTLSTGMTIGSGSYDSKNKVIKDSGQFIPALEEKVRSFRSELSLIDPDSYKRTIFTEDKAGKEFKTMEVEYHRKR